MIGDENPLRAAERTKQRIAGQLCVPFWTVVIVPSRLLQKEHSAAYIQRMKTLGAEGNA